jgi:hypothetical protein
LTFALRTRGWVVANVKSTPLVQQLLQSDRLFSRIKRDGGVAVVELSAAIGDLLQDRVAFNDVQSETFACWKNAENDVVRVNDGFQRPNLVVRRANEMSGMGCELVQFFKLGHGAYSNATNCAKVA